MERRITTTYPEVSAAEAIINNFRDLNQRVTELERRYQSLNREKEKE